MPKVYVIDDSMSVCFAIERMLRARGMEVISERSGEAALRGLVEHGPDLVLCDLVLPDVEGFEICSFIQGHPRLSSTPVIVISGIVDDAVRAQAHRVGAIGVLKKPFATEELVALVERVFGGREMSAGESVPRSGAGSTDPAGSPDSPARTGTASASSAPPPPGVEAPIASTTAELEALEEGLAPLGSIEVLRFACLLTPDGSVRGFGAHKPEPDELAHVPELARFAAAAAGRLRLGRLGTATFETEHGVLVVTPWKAGCLLVLGLGDLSVLGKTRYILRRLAADEPIPGWTE
ncbi:MAG: response regulator [Holophagales bacterium]|nr:response regulator [Holophagales bacterium]